MYTACAKAVLIYYKSRDKSLEYLYYAKLAAVLVAGIMLGRWFDQERKQLKEKGEPSFKTWTTVPGIIIIVIICLLAAFRVYLRFYAN